jgi:hypothetical protein
MNETVGQYTSSSVIVLTFAGLPRLAFDTLCSNRPSPWLGLFDFLLLRFFDLYFLCWAHG